MEVTVNRPAYRFLDGGRKLHNGDILVIHGKCFLVSTFGSQDEIEQNNNVDGYNRNFCSLINLKDGSRALRDPLPRNSKAGDIATLLSPMFPASYYGDKLGPRDINIIAADTYGMTIS